MNEFILTYLVSQITHNADDTKYHIQMYGMTKSMNNVIMAHANLATLRVFMDKLSQLLDEIKQDDIVQKEQIS